MTKSKQNGSLTTSEILQTQLFNSSRPPLANAYLLCAETLLPLIARYLRRQQINFKVSQRLDTQKRLLFISQNLEDRKKTLPRFVLAYLEELPRCQLFYQYSPASTTKPGNGGNNCGFWVEYGFQHPLPATEIADHLQAKNLYFVFGNQQNPALIIDPVPILKNDCDFSKPQALIKKNQYSFTTADISDAALLQIRLRLVDDVQTNVAPQALHLEGKELRWLEKISRHLPGPLLSRLRWAGNREHTIILLPEEDNLSLFPFAEPLIKIKANLFVPLKQKLSPQLTGVQLEEALALAPEKLTFLTRKWRFDIAAKDFKPLDKMILTTPTENITLEFSAPDKPFDFSWFNKVEREIPTSQPTEASNHTPAPLTISKSNKNEPQPSSNLNNPTDTPTEILKTYALKLHRQNDFLGAATCFSLAEEPLPAAECYRLAALALEQ